MRASAPKDDDQMSATFRLYHGTTLGVRGAGWFTSVDLNAYRNLASYAATQTLDESLSVTAVTVELNKAGN